MKRGHVHAPTWDRAIQAVQQAMLELAVAVPLTDEQDDILTAAFRRCESLTARKYLAFAPTNAEIARKYGISLRTVTNWRREGCPFERGQWRVLPWLARRRYAPSRTEAKFSKRLRHLRFKAIVDEIKPIRAEVLAVKALFRQHGLPMDDWLKSMPWRAR